MSASPEWPLRPAQATDAAALAALLTAEGYPAGPGDILERLERWDDGRSAVLVATAREEVVGFVAVHVMPRFEHGDWIARVLALVVDEGVRERGVGSELMKAAESHALERGCAFIEVTAGRHRPGALQLYESVGYEPGVAVYLRRRL
jgi:GNAT superfamily N-acetyltransferase